jgi:hypothetical protein
VRHQPGVKHQNADALSRQPQESSADTSGARVDPHPADSQRPGTAQAASATAPPVSKPPLAVHALASAARTARAEALLHAAAVHVPERAAPFSEEFCPSPCEALAGWNGWYFELTQSADDAEPVAIRLERTALHTRAQDWRAARKLALRQGAAPPNADPNASPPPANLAGATFFDAATKQGFTLCEWGTSLCAGLEACLRAGVRVNKYIVTDTTYKKRLLITTRVRALMVAHASLFDSAAWEDMFTLLPPNAAEVSTASLQKAGLGSGEQWLLMAYWEQ